jgi:hypothetical protein
MAKTQSSVTTEKQSQQMILVSQFPYMTIKHAIRTCSLILAVPPVVVELAGINSALRI